MNANYGSYHNKVIFSPKNVDVLDISNTILLRIQGVSKEYLGVDTAKNVVNESLDVYLPIEFLNTLTPNGLPPHKHLLKVYTWASHQFKPHNRNRCIRKT